MHLPVTTASAMSDAARARLLDRLLAECGRGDQAAFRALYDLLAPRLTGVALRIVRDRALARDVTHDTFLQVWRQAGRFDPALGSAEGWLIGIARLRAISLVRRRGREVLRDPPDEPDHAPDALERLLRMSHGEALRACLGQLEAGHQRLIVLAYVEGLSHGELAARLGWPLGTVKSTMRRCLADLRRCMRR